MKIAYASCEADKRSRFYQYVTEYFDKRNEETEVFVFDTPEEMLDSVADNVYDTVFFNMTYGDKPGIKYVYKMRAFNPDVAIVILRFTPAGRVECIVANPMMLVLDDFSSSSFGSLLDIVTSNINTNPECSILLRTTSDIGRIVPVTSLVYAESSSHKVYVHLTSGEIIETFGPIRTLFERLKVNSAFLFPHRSFIVNAFYISCITTDTIYLRASQKAVPIARGKLRAVKDAYDCYFRGYGRHMNVANVSAENN